MKEKFMDIVASSLNFESFSENCTLHPRHQFYKNFYSQDIIFQQNELRGPFIKEGFCKDILQIAKIF